MYTSRYKKNIIITKYFDKILITTYQKGVTYKNPKTFDYIKHNDADLELFSQLGIEDYKNIKNIQKIEAKKYRTRKNIIEYVNNNFTKNSSFWYFSVDPKKYFDYAKNLKLFKNNISYFFKKLKKQSKSKLELKYLCVFEQHKTGLWHCHTIMNINPKKNLVEKLWTLGFCNVKKISFVKNLGLYLAKYLTKSFKVLGYKEKSFIKSQNVVKPKKYFFNDIPKEFLTASYIKSYNTIYHGKINKYYLFDKSDESNIIKLNNFLENHNGYN